MPTRPRAISEISITDSPSKEQNPLNFISNGFDVSPNSYQRNSMFTQQPIFVHPQRYQKKRTHRQTDISKTKVKESNKKRSKLVETDENMINVNAENEGDAQNISRP